MIEPRTIEDRLDHLERGRNYWRIAAILSVAALAVAMFALMSNGSRMRRLVVIDSRGEPRGSFMVSEFVESPVLELYDPQGTARFAVAVDDALSGASLYDSQGRLRAKLYAIDQAESSDPNSACGTGLNLIAPTIEEAGLGLFDAAGALRAKFFIENDQPRIELYGEHGQTLWSAP